MSNTTEYDYINNFIEVTFEQKDHFLRIAETLTRVGVLSADGKKLYQSAHILHKRGKYYIVSFKEIFLLDGKDSSFSDDDRYRRSKIALLLEEWGLLKIQNPEKLGEVTNHNSKIDVIPYKEKGNYTLVSKYTIGKKKGANK